ncbi:MAG: penicillin-binding protein activator [Gemmatimonadetes bacterium]|nr:penicillin-binding protein activator [Gemmatimonadota bacterium]
MIGVIVAQSAPPPLRVYSQLVLEGVRLALQEHGRGGGAPIELVVLDDSGRAERDTALLRELERRGAVGVVGPLLSSGLALVAGARQDSALVFVSPTASNPPRSANVYSLNIPDTRGAEVLAEYALATGLTRVGLLYPDKPEWRRQARAFAESLERGGGEVPVEAPYDSGTTTFGPPLRRLAAAGPQAIYIPAPERDVRQLAPQIAYYGLDQLGIQVLGNETWVDDDVRRLVEPRFLNGVIASTPLVRASSEVRWQEFVALYEGAHRRLLNNPYPALGFDAVNWILSALPPNGALAHELAERLASGEPLRGATGILHARNGEVVRRPFLVRIQDGDLQPVEDAGAASPPADSSAAGR